ncbi:MAG TPA: hypothetical protein VGJ46_06635, partial [Candidatus Limnocylindrales bacterium]
GMGSANPGVDIYTQVQGYRHVGGTQIGVYEMEDVVTVLSHVDPAAEVACTLPVLEAGGRLNAFGDLIGDRLDDVARSGDRLRIRIRRDGDADLETKARAWAIEEKGCCAFLGFEIESDPDSVTLDIIAPEGAGATLEGIEWIARTAGWPA